MSCDIICYIYIYHLTRHMPPHYIVKHRCSKMSHNIGILVLWHNIWRRNYHTVNRNMASVTEQWVPRHISPKLTEFIHEIWPACSDTHPRMTAPLTEDGLPIFEHGQPIYEDRLPIFKDGQPIFVDGLPIFVFETRSCNARRHNDVEGHNSFF